MPRFRYQQEKRHLSVSKPRPHPLRPLDLVQRRRGSAIRSRDSGSHEGAGALVSDTARSLLPGACPGRPPAQQGRLGGGAMPVCSHHVLEPLRTGPGLVDRIFRTTRVHSGETSSSQPLHMIARTRTSEVRVSDIRGSCGHEVMRGTVPRRTHGA